MLKERLRALLIPPVFEDEEKTRVAILLNTILLALLVPALPELLITIVQGNPEDTLTILVLVVIILGLWWLMRRGHVLLSGVLISLALLGGFTLFLLTGNGLHDLTILGYPMIMALASLLLGKNAPLLFSLLALLCLAGVYMVESAGLIDTPFRALSGPEDMAIIAVLLGLTAVFLRVMIASLHNSLDRARHNEARLAEANRELALENAERSAIQAEIQYLNDQLEQRVENRTAALQTANERLVELSRVKDEFVSNVSHELRTPITSLKLRHHLLVRQPERSAEHLEVVKREIERLETLIEDLLTLSRIDQERIEFKFEPVNLNTLLANYVSDRQPLAASRTLDLAFTPAPDLPLVQADEHLIGQVISILLTNALNYTPSGGRVRVITGLRAASEAAWAGFSVRDTGPGISPEEQPSLFTRFYRGEAGRASGIPGTGLGLAIAREIINHHQGQLEIASTGVPGEGAAFSVWLPLN